MADEKTCLNRRAVLKGIAVVPLAVALTHHRVAHAANLSPDDPQAKALGYMAKSDKPGKHCANCQLWQGGSAAHGKCAIFGAKHVARTGWCKSYTPKA